MNEDGLCICGCWCALCEVSVYADMPTTVLLQNNCTVIGNYAHRLLISVNNRCTISSNKECSSQINASYDHTFQNQ